MPIQDKGWFKVKGIRPHGDRTLAEQMIGLDLALQAAVGKSVLDLGCAEGLISREFALAGATEVLGIELLYEHLEVAKKVCKDVPQVTFMRENLTTLANAVEVPSQFDIVLALGIIHKIKDPTMAMRFAARSCKELLAFRPPAYAQNGMVKSKHSDSYVNVSAVMIAEGFREGETIAGVRGESVQYWHRK